jgi:hypothetical protein
MAGWNALLTSARNKAREITAPFLLRIRSRGFLGRLLVVLATFWWLTDQVSRLDFLLGKLAASKPLLGAAWAWFKSVPSGIYQTAMFVAGLAWTWWTWRHPRPIPVATDSVRMELGPPTPAVPPKADREGSAPITSGRPLVRDTVHTPTPSRTILMFDVCWEISPKMWNPTYREIQTPSPDTLDRIIFGPNCLKCSRVLRISEPAVGGPVYKIENPCPRCGRSVRTFPGSFVDLQREVYKEVDRLIRRDEVLPAGGCGPKGK